MLSQEAHTIPRPARLGHPVRGTSRQLTLPLAPPGSPVPAPPVLALLAGVVPVRPRQVWARLSPPVQAAVRRVVWQVLEEVLHDEPRP